MLCAWCEQSSAEPWPQLWTSMWSFFLLLIFNYSLVLKSYIVFSGNEKRKIYMRESAEECEILTFTCLLSSAVVFQTEFTFLRFFFFFFIPSSHWVPSCNCKCMYLTGGPALRSQYHLQLCLIRCKRTSYRKSSDGWSAQIVPCFSSPPCTKSYNIMFRSQQSASSMNQATLRL